MAEEWSNERTLHFIELLSAEPVIWDPKHKQHKLKHKVHDAWVRLEDAMNTNRAELKTKKKSLMASFRPLVNKKKASQRSGASTEDLFQPTWFAYEAMEQFLGSIYDVKRTTNTEEEPGNENIGIENLQNVDPKETLERRKRRNQSVDNAQRLSLDSVMSSPEYPAISLVQAYYSPSSSPENMQSQNVEANTMDLTPETEMEENANPNLNAAICISTQETSRRRRMLPELASVENRMHAAFENLNNVLKERPPPENDCDVYGKLVATRLKKLTEKQREFYMFKIDEVWWHIRSTSDLEHTSSDFSEPSKSSPYSSNSHDVRRPPTSSLAQSTPSRPNLIQASPSNRTQPPAQMPGIYMQNNKFQSSSYSSDSHDVQSPIITYSAQSSPPSSNLTFKTSQSNPTQPPTQMPDQYIQYNQFQISPYSSGSHDDVQSPPTSYLDQSSLRPHMILKSSPSNLTQSPAQMPGQYIQSIRFQSSQRLTDSNYLPRHPSSSQGQSNPTRPLLIVKKENVIAPKPSFTLRIPESSPSTLPTTTTTTTQPSTQKHPHPKKIKLLKNVKLN